jgi:ribonuclease D
VQAVSTRDLARLAGSTDVAEVAALARTRGRLGIDTEFMSEGRYRALLCLTQVAVEESDPPTHAQTTSLAQPATASDTPPDNLRTIMIDGLDQAVDVAPLAAVLADPAIEVVLHAGRQDVAILRRVWRTEVTNIFDTQIAAGFAGESAQSGYGNLLAAILKLRLGKTASYTRWDARPLTAEQLSYAAEDVVHLLALADELQRRLRASGRYEWAVEECRRLEGATDERDPETAWERLPRVAQLDATSRAVAKRLAAWRERTAAAEDRPVGSVIQDAPLVEIAKRRPRDSGRLGQIRGLHPPIVKRRGDALLEAVRLGLEDPPIPRESRRTRSEPGDAPLIALTEALLRARSIEAGLAYELLASRSELELIVAAARESAPEPAVRTLTGWRRSLVGDEVKELLSGRAALLVDGRRRLELRGVDGSEPEPQR